MADLLQLLDSKQPIYVTNHSSSTILLELKQPVEGAKTRLVKIPPITKYPIPLHKLIPYPVLQHDSSSLHRWIHPKMLRLHDPEIVERSYRKEPDMEDVIVNTVQEANSRRVFTDEEKGESPLRTAAGAQDRAKKEAGKKDYGATEQQIYDMQVETQRREFAVSAASKSVHPQITAMMTSLLEDPSIKSEVLAKLRTLDDDVLTIEALNFILDNSDDFEQIRKWARGELASREG